MVNAVTTCFLILAVAIRVTLTSNYAYRSQCHGQHITATSDEVRQVLWETKTIITFISGNSFPSIRSRLVNAIVLLMFEFPSTVRTIRLREGTPKG